MAFSAKNLQKLSGGGGAAGTSQYEYTTNGTDTVATVTESGYFNNADDFLNLRVGDRILITVPGTQALDTDRGNMFKQIVDVGSTMVMSVSTAGVVNCSADFEATTLTYT